MKGSENTKIALRNIRAVLPNHTIESSGLLIERDQIARIFDSTKDLPPADQDIDLEGLTVFPGFIDVHIHGAVGVDVMQASIDDLALVSEFLATQGVTAWLPTTVPAPFEDYQRAIAAINGLIRQQMGARLPQARALGVHYEGPFVNQSQCGALRTDYFATYSEPSALDLLPVPEEKVAVRMTTLAPEIDGGIALIRELTARGWVSSIGHTRATIEILDQAAEVGARHMTHFMNAMTPFHHRSPGPVAWGLSRDDVTCDIIADGIHLDPFVLNLLLRVKSADRLTLISDAIAAAGRGDGSYDIWGETIQVRNGRTSNARGSIAGSVITMVDAVRLMLSLGARETDVAKMAATNPARLLGLDRDCGSIEEGKRADLVVLNSEGNIAMTIVGGVIVQSVT